MKLAPVTLITIAATSIAFGALIVFLIVSDRDPVLLITAIVTLVPTLGVLFGTNKTIKQTNGTLSSMRQHAISKEIENSQLRSMLTPEQASSVPISVVISESPVE